MLTVLWASPTVNAESPAVMVESWPNRADQPATAVGFFVDRKGTFVTCRHVCEGSRHVSVNLGVLGSYSVDAVLVDDEINDILVVRVSLPKDVAIKPLAPTVLQPVVGSTWTRLSIDGTGSESKASHRVIESNDVDERAFVRISGSAVQGESGSPLLDESGRLIGLTFGFDPGFESVLGIPAITISRAVDLAMAVDDVPYGQWYDEQALLAGGSYWELVKRGSEAYQTNRWNDALQYNLAVFLARGSNVRALSVCTSAMIAMGRSNEELVVWLSALQRSIPNDASVLLAQGHVLYRQRRFVEAESCYRRAYMLNDGVASAYWIGAALGSV